MLLYLLLGYLLYGSSITLFAYFRGEFGSSASVWSVLASVIIEPLHEHYLSLAHWGNVPWLSAGRGALILFAKVGACALILYLLYSALLARVPESLLL